MPKVSIVVPVYNPGSKLKLCIRSILRQTETDFVLILIDDGSTDGNSAVCDWFAIRDPRIRVIHQANQGSVAARKTGVEQCRAPFSCFCDADDTMPPIALAKLLHHIGSTDVCGETISNYGILSPAARNLLPPAFRLTRRKSMTRKLSFPNCTAVGSESLMSLSPCAESCIAQNSYNKLTAKCLS